MNAIFVWYENSNTICNVGLWTNKWAKLSKESWRENNWPWTKCECVMCICNMILWSMCLFICIIRFFSLSNFLFYTLVFFFFNCIRQCENLNMSTVMSHHKRQKPKWQSNNENWHTNKQHANHLTHYKEMKWYRWQFKSDPGNKFCVNRIHSH